VLAHETDVTATVDPFAGSYVVESMTDDLEEAARSLMGQVADLGGAVAAIERGFQKTEIERSAYRITREIEAGKRTVVGVNRFRVDADEPYTPLPVDPEIEERQAARLARLRRERDGAEVRRHLDALRAAAAARPGPEHNALYPMHDALRARATVGEVCNALREVWGVHVPADAF
jgi:methylmalonyl-CoA mutase N-terminal domain/subunit